ncbi:hypothetical protein F383_23438 [Gossypium arboreum]|uniref:Uncharacterized protein n=1 Tax=Gossypium arboreum TaxID=29729 RepID=A0A0B0NY99_GOSAR|nr:hypothetical protein F383_23438 [Gossypium arboreum]
MDNCKYVMYRLVIRMIVKVTGDIIWYILLYKLSHVIWLNLMLYFDMFWQIVVGMEICKCVLIYGRFMDGKCMILVKQLNIMWNWH